MEKYIEILLNSYSGYFNYLKTKFYTWTGITIFMVWLLFHWSYGYLKLYFLGAKNKRFYAKIFGSIYFIFFQFFLTQFFLLLSNVMEQFINDTLHIFGFELMSIQLFFNIRITTSPRFIFILPHKRLYSMECTAYCIRFLSYGKSIKHTTVLKKWGLRRILDTTGWNLLFTNQYCISLLSLLEV
jgi:hypothetical protein